MSEGTSFSHRIPGLLRTSRTSELEGLLDLLPYACLLVETGDWRILHANPTALELSNYTRAELVGLDVMSLFAGNPASAAGLGDVSLPLTGAAATGGGSMIQRLVRSDQTQVIGRLWIKPLKSKEKLSLLLFESSDSLAGITDPEGRSPLWNGLIQLLEAASTDDIQSGLDQALKAAGNLSGAELLLIYRLKEREPEIQRLAGIGATELLPERLEVQDLVYLNQTRLWEARKHPSCRLYRAARASGLQYLASAPIGETNAMVGLAVLAGARASAPDSVLGVARMLALVVESIFQQHIRLTSLKSELHQKATQARALSIISDKVQEGILWLSPELRIRSLNPRMEQILGYASREVAGQPVEIILIGSDSLLQELESAKKGSSTFHLDDVKLYRRNGEAFQALLRIFPVRMEEQIDGILVFAQDLSEQEQFRLHAQDLENRASLGELTAILAHEIRNPINNISTSLQLLGMNLPSDDPEQEAISRMLQDCERLDSLVRSVLAFSKTTEYEMETLDLSALLQRLLERKKPSLAEGNILVDLEIEPGCPLINGNLRALEQVFNNLINNAVQAMGERGSGNLTLKMQSIHLDEGSEYVEVSVADTGPGIPKEILEHIFQPFFTTKRDGTGLGLSISKRIITAHKGNIQVASFPIGTIFSVRLPAAENGARTE